MEIKRKYFRYSKKYYSWAIACLERDNYKCVKCNETENIIVHHLDESRKKGVTKMNNSLDNLISLCKIHHAQIHGYTLTIKNPRVALINELRSQGKTYKEIGNYLGITRQRIHQLSKRI